MISLFLLGAIIGIILCFFVMGILMVAEIRPLTAFIISFSLVMSFLLVAEWLFKSLLVGVII